MTPAHDALLNHASVIGVTCCHPMSGRYCAVGRELWLDYRAQCVADVGRLMRHLSDKMWFPGVREETLQLILDALEEAA